MDTRPSPNVKRRDMGLASAIVVLAQLASTFSTNKNISVEFETLKISFEQLRLDQERFFVRKEEVKLLSIKMDRMNEELVRLNEQMKSIKDIYAVTPIEESEDIIGCVYQTTLQPPLEMDI